MGEPKNCTRVQISLNNEILAKLDSCCEELACPRSVYIAMALKQKWQSEEQIRQVPAMLQAVGEMVRCIDELKENPVAFAAGLPLPELPDA